jgi:hypothetical protein
MLIGGLVIGHQELVHTLLCESWLVSPAGDYRRSPLSSDSQFGCSVESGV